MDSISCPHCNASNPADATFCVTCGRAVQSNQTNGPSIIEASDMAQTTAGRTLQADELQKQLKKASGAMLAVAILQCVFGGLLFVIGSAAIGAPGGQTLPPIVFVSVFVVALIFFGLYVWARYNPFPAAICGLVIYITLHLLDALADPTMLIRGIVVKIIIVVILARAVSAGARYRKLQQEMASS